MTVYSEARCLLCGNVWIRGLQPVCDACGCGSYQAVEESDAERRTCAAELQHDIEEGR